MPPLESPREGVIATVIVCCCLSVSDRAIRRLVASGAARSVDELASTCGAGTDCGACCPLLESLVEEAYSGVYRANHVNHTGNGGVTCADTIKSSRS